METSIIVIARKLSICDDSYKLSYMDRIVVINLKMQLKNARGSKMLDRYPDMKRLLSTS